MYCTNCGRAARPGERYCARCGMPLTVEEVHYAEEESVSLDEVNDAIAGSLEMVQKFYDVCGAANVLLVMPSPYETHRMVGIIARDVSLAVISFCACMGAVLPYAYFASNGLLKVAAGGKEALVRPISSRTYKMLVSTRPDLLITEGADISQAFYLDDLKPAVKDALKEEPRPLLYWRPTHASVRPAETKDTSSVQAESAIRRANAVTEKYLKDESDGEAMASAAAATAIGTAKVLGKGAVLAAKGAVGLTRGVMRVTLWGHLMSK